MVFLYFTGHYNDVVVCSCPIEFIIYPYRTKRLLWHNAEHKISINNRKEDGQGTLWFGISSSRVHITDDHLALLLWGTLPNILPVEVFRVGGVEVHPLHLHPLHATRKPMPESKKLCVDREAGLAQGIRGTCFEHPLGGLALRPLGKHYQCYSGTAWCAVRRWKNMLVFTWNGHG